MSFTSAARAVSGAALAGALLLGVAPAASADEIRDEQWALEAFDVEKVWQESTGEDVTVAVLDDAVNGDHPDLRKNVLPGKDMVNGGPANKKTNEDHGTAMAALIAGHGHGPGNKDGVVGLAPDAKILPVALTKSPKGEGGKLTNFAEGLRYAVDEGASVINMSFGGSALTDGEEEALAYAASKDVLVVAGAGNDGARMGYPARSPSVVGVGAITEAGNMWEDSNFGKQLMLTAPGDRIRSAAATEPYRLSSGTSNASAYVSGAAALLRAKFPDLSAGQIANRLVKTALMPESIEEKRDLNYGYGMIRPLRALTEDIPAGSERGPLEAPDGTLPPEPGEPGDGKGEGNNESDNAGSNQASDDDGMTTSQLAGIGIVGLSVVGLIIGAIIFFKKRGNRSNDPPPPGNWGGPGGGPGYGSGGGQAPPPQYMPSQPPAPGQYHQPPPGSGTYPQNQPPQGPPGY